MSFSMGMELRQTAHQKPNARCNVCDRWLPINADGRLRKHRPRRSDFVCPGSHREVKTCEHCGHELTHEGLNCSPGCRANVGARYLGGGS